MILWHVGGTIAAVRYVFRDPAMDLRFPAVGAVLPNLVDKPVGLLLWNDRFGTGRLWGHTLVFSVVLLVAVMTLTRRGSLARRQWLGLPIGTLLHLLLDGMWSSPETFWWPLAGSSFPVMEPSTLAGLAIERITTPAALVGAAAGLAYLTYLWLINAGDAATRRRILRTGTIPFDN